MTAGPSIPRIAVTGLGVVSPIGIGTSAFWQSLIDGRSGIDTLRSFPSEGLPSKLAAEIRDFDPYEHIYQPKFIKAMSRDIQLGVSAASMAMRDAGLPRGSVDPARLGVEFGAGHISYQPQQLIEAARVMFADGEENALARLASSGMETIHPLWLLKQLPNMPACHVAIEHDARGPNNTITACESSALLALAEAVNIIERDAADVVIVGGCSSHIDPLEMSRLSLYESLSREDDPERACLPFDRDRDGTVVGEGAASFVVERWDHAVRRGANIYCEILGIGSGCDGAGPRGRQEAVGLTRAIDAALRRSGLSPRDLGHMNAHGKATDRDDIAESRAYQQSFGMQAGRIPVTALKSYFGHFGAGSGAVELAGSLLALRHGWLPMTVNYRNPDPLCPLNVVRAEPIRCASNVAMSVNRTRNGQSAATVIRAV